MTLEVVSHLFLVAYLWGVIPCIFLAIFVSSLVIAGSTDERRNQRKIARYGVVAGSISFVMFSLAILSSISAPVLFPNVNHLLIFWMGTGVAGFCLGFFGMLTISRLRNTALVGFITLMLSFGGLAGLFSYIFQLFTEPVPFVIMGAVLGGAIFQMIDLAPRGDENQTPTIGAAVANPTLLEK